MATSTNSTLSTLRGSSLPAPNTTKVPSRPASGSQAEHRPSAPKRRRTRREAEETIDVHSEIAHIEEALKDAPRGAVLVLFGELERLRAIALVTLVSAQPVAVEREADENLSAEEAARRLGVSTDWLYKADLPFKAHIGRRVVFSAAGLGQWNRQRRQSNKEPRR